MSERTHHQLHSPESDPKFSGGPTSGEKTGLFHAPPKPGALDSMQTGQIEPIAPTQDPSVGLLETLQAVKDKQQGGATSPSEVADISGVQAQKSTLDRLMNAQSAVFGAATLILVLSVWGLIHLADQATKNIGKTEKPPASLTKTAEQSATPPAIQPPPPVTQAQPQAPKPTLKSPPAVPAQTPAAIRQQNAAAIQAEKERLAREEQERAQREKEREEEEKRERERQLRELEGASDQPQEAQPPQNPDAPPPPNPDAVPPPNPENG